MKRAQPVAATSRRNPCSSASPRQPFRTVTTRPLAKTVRWYRENEWWWRPIKDEDPEYRTYYQSQYGNR